MLQWLHDVAASCMSPRCSIQTSCESCADEVIVDATKERECMTIDNAGRLTHWVCSTSPAVLQMMQSLLCTQAISFRRSTPAVLLQQAASKTFTQESPQNGFIR